MQQGRRRFLERSAGIVAGGSLVGLAGCNSISGFTGGGGAEHQHRVSYGETVQGQIDESDPTGERGYHEEIYFEGEAGDVVTISMESEPGDTYLILEDPSGMEVNSNDDADFELNSQISNHMLRSSGQYTIVATSYRTEATFPYRVSLQKVGERADSSDAGDAGGGEGSSPTLISYGDSVTGQLTTGDSTGYRGYYDAYDFDASAGDLVRIEMWSETGDTYLMLQGPNGRIVTEDDDGGSGLNSTIDNYELSSSGRYRIIATSYSDDATFQYQLGLEEVDPDEPAGGDVSPTPISYGETVQGELTTGDPTGFRGYYDLYSFGGSPGDVVTIRMQSEPGDSYLILLDPNGERVAENDDGSDTAFLDAEISDHELESAGTYRIVATSFSESDTFPYQLTLTQ